MPQVIRTVSQLGKLIKNYREEKGVSQQKLSKEICIGQKSISFIENGKDGVRLDTLFRVLNELDLELIVQPKTKVSHSDW